MSSPCYLHFTPTQFRLIAPAGHDGVQIWATLDVGSVFANYRIESHNHNEITVEVVAESLARALRSAAGATEVMLRLGKRDGEPLLSLSIGMASHTGAKLDVTQDVLVRILRVSEMNLITEPMCPTPDVRVHTLTDAGLYCNAAFGGSEGYGGTDSATRYTSLPGRQPQWCIATRCDG